MYYTLAVIDDTPEIIEHDTHVDAMAFAQDVARDGFQCVVLLAVATVEAEEQPMSLEEFYGVKSGIDFPATLYKGSAA